MSISSLFTLIFNTSTDYSMEVDTKKLLLNGDGWRRDFLVCLVTSSLLCLGPLIDFLRHPVEPLFLPFTSMPDFSVYVSIFRRAALNGLTGDPFIWEHRMDSGSIFSVYHFWPDFFGFWMRYGGDGMIPFIGWILSALWFFGLFRFCRALGQSRPYAFFTAGIACFFSVNMAYNFNGYKFNVGVWNFSLTEHLRPYPTVSSLAIYAMAVYAFFAAAVQKSVFRIVTASFLIALTTLGRPFDWMVLETAVVGTAFVAFFQKNHEQFKTCLWVIFISSVLASPIIWILIQYQTLHHAEYHDQMWRGVFHAKSLMHYAKYTAGLGFAAILLFGLYRWATGSGKIRAWPLQTFFPCILVLASLLPYYQTILSRITITGISYFFVFSFGTWFPIAVLHALWLGKLRRNPNPSSSMLLPAILLVLIISQQLALGFLQRERQIKNVIPVQLRQLYENLSRQTPADTVVLSFRNEGELVSQTGKWSFSPTPLVLTMITSAPTTELLARALWSEYILFGSIDSLEPLFSPEGISNINPWLVAQPLKTQQAVDRLKQKIGVNTFIFHPQLSKYDLEARKLTLPPKLSASTDFGVYFTDDFCQTFRKVRSAIRSPNPLKNLPYKLDMILVTPDYYSQSERKLSEIGFEKIIDFNGFEVWKRINR